MPSDTDKPTDDNLFEIINGKPTYFGATVKISRVTIAGKQYEIAGMRDAADLLDHPEFAHQFIQYDLAPYGLQLWKSSIYLAELLAEEKPPRDAIELGCGVGLVSLVLTDAGWHVTATDHDPAALAFTAHNAARNGTRLTGIERLDWHHPPPNKTYDLIVGADLTYQENDQLPLLETIKSLLSRTGRAYLCDPNRIISDDIPKLAADRGLQTTLLERPTPLAPRVWKLAAT